MTATLPETEQRPPVQPRHRWRWIGFLAAGVLLAAALAGILVGGNLGGGGGGGPQVAPGLDSATANVLSLDVLGSGNAFTAPGFSLTDQNGRPVSLAQFRGRSVVLTFNDDECTDLCTLLAQDLLVTQRDLGRAAGQVVFLSVNVNPFHPDVAAVKTWTDEHQLSTLPNWYFGTAPVPALEAIWKAYGIYVQTDPTTQSVVHGTQMFFIGPSGKVQATGDFGTTDADTTYFAHATAQMAVDLLPASQRPTVGGPTTPPPTRGNVSPGAPAPAFALPRLGAPGTVHLSDLAGEPLVLSFFSDTCVPCKAELPQLQAASGQLGPKVRFLGIDVGDAPAGARAFAAAAGVHFTLASDRNGSVASAYGVTGTPDTVIVGPGGTIKVLHPTTFTTEQVLYVVRTLWPSLAPPGS